MNSTGPDAFLFSRNLTEVLLNTQHLEFFREFLRERGAETPLQFLVAIQKISVETNEKIYKSLFENIIKTFFHGKNSPGMHSPLLKLFPLPFRILSLGKTLGKTALSLRKQNRAAATWGSIETKPKTVKAENNNKRTLKN